MRLTLFTKQKCSDSTCSSNAGYLKLENYLGEFLTEVLKARARKNLGIEETSTITNNYIIVKDITELKQLDSENLSEGMLCYVNKDLDGRHFYIYLNGLWEVAKMQSTIDEATLGVPIYTSEILEDLGDEIPKQYIFVPSESDLQGEITLRTYNTSQNGTYIDVLFSAIRSLQSEVAKLKNSFRYGINSYTDANTALSSSIEEDTDSEPIWAVDEDDLSLIFSMPMKSGNKLEPSSNVNTTITNLLTIKDTATFKSFDLNKTSDPKLFLYITSSEKTITVNLLSSNNSELSIDLSKLQHNSCSLYNYMIMVNRKQHTTNGDKGNDYVYVLITNGYTDSEIYSGYWKDNKLVDLVNDIGDNYYFSSVDLKNLTLKKFDIYSKYQDFSNSVFPSIPEEEDYKYEAAHITIRSVKSKEVLDEIAPLILNNEFIWEETNEKLYIKSKDKIIAIGATTTSDDNNNNNNKPNTGMDESEVLELLKEIGILVDEDSQGNFENLHLNNIADLTFIHQESGNKFKVSVDSEGNLLTSKVTDIEKLEDNTYVKEALNLTGNIRGLIGTSGAYIYRNSIGSSTDVNQITSNIGLNSDRLKIGAVYSPKEGDEAFGCSHAYIELENTSNRDFNLDGCYLHFGKKVDNSVVVKHLALTGVIYAGSTYLIRGKQYNTATSPDCFINVSTFDQEWYDNGELIDLTHNSDGIGLLLTLGNDDITYDKSLLSINGSTYSNYDPSFIDAIYIANAKLDGSNSYWAASAFTSTSNCIFKNTFELDPANQAYQALYSKDSSRVRWNKPGTDYQYLTLNKEYIEFPHTDDKFPISNYTPKASFENKNVSTDKSKLDLYKPNMVTCSFGIDIYKTRCFNWISAGVFDEYVFIKNSDGTWNKFESYKTINSDNTQSNNYPRRREFSKDINNTIYARIISTFPADGTKFTAHKCIIDVTNTSAITPIEFTYVVGRADKNGNPDPDHSSEEQTFTIYPSTYPVVVYQITDQQGFHWVEYQTWAAAANKLAEEIASTSNVQPILINTGDMTQNGTRINEWIDYYNAGKDSLFNKYELMNVVGNNDLCGTVPTELGTGDDNGKSNSYYFHLFYCYEIDEDIPPVYRGSDNVLRYIPSLYYFNSSNRAFLMVNSEITEINCKDWFKANSGSATINIYTGFTIGKDDTKYYVADTNNSYIYTLLYQILTKLKDKKVTVACHEMPFTVITESNLTNANANLYRSYDTSMGLVGSHLNLISYDEQGKGTYWFSRLLEYFRVPLCIGGHKHTYSCTYPLRENYDGIDLNSPMTMEETLENDSVNFISNTNLNLTKFPYANRGITSEADPAVGYFYPVTDTTSDLVGAVTYFMCQATGYKLSSNKELPSANLRFSKFVPETPSASSPSSELLYPMFGIISYNSDSIEIKLARIKGIKTSANKFDLNTYNTSNMTIEYLTDGTKYYGTWTSNVKNLITL